MEPKQNSSFMPIDHKGPTQYNDPNQNWKQIHRVARDAKRGKTALSRSYDDYRTSYRSKDDYLWLLYKF